MPLAGYSAYKMKKGFKKHKDLSIRAKSCKDALDSAKFLLTEGKFLLEQGQKEVQSNNTDNGKMEHGKKLLSQGQQLMAMSVEIIEKSKINLSLIAEKQQEIKFDLFEHGISIPADLAECAYSISEGIDKVVKGASKLPISHALHFIGVGGGVLGAVIGGIQTYKHSIAIHEQQEKIKELKVKQKKLSSMEKTPLTEAFIKSEKAKPLREESKAILKISNESLALASSICLTIAGLLILASILTGGIPSTDLHIIAIGFVSTAFVLSVCHYVKMRQTAEIGFEEIDFKKIQSLIHKKGKDDVSVKKIAHYLNADLELFVINPLPYLEKV